VWSVKLHSEGKSFKCAVRSEWTEFSPGSFLLVQKAFCVSSVA
jgi:hypothetical protein